jgi:hypothetical protein
MKVLRIAPLALVSTALLCAAPALADHNSKNGEGWANMPNDIHNTRIDTRTSGDNEAFKDFVRYGNGAESINRFDVDGGGTRKAAQSGPVEAANEAGQARQSRQAVETRQSSRVRQSVGVGGASQSGTRKGGGGRGGH